MKHGTHEPIIKIGNNTYFAYRSPLSENYETIAILVSPHFHESYTLSRMSSQSYLQHQFEHEKQTTI